MSEQIALDYEPRKMARSADPASSHAAAERIDAKGQRVLVLGLVKAHPGRTARQYDQMLHDEKRWNRTAGRRLPELRNLGLIRSAQGGTREQRWFPVAAL